MRFPLKSARFIFISPSSAHRAVSMRSLSSLHRHVKKIKTHLWTSSSRYGRYAYEGNRNSKDEITLRGIPESVIRTRQLGPNRDSPGRARELTRKFQIDLAKLEGRPFNEIRSSLRFDVWSSFYGHFFDACTPSPPLLLADRPTDDCNYFCDTSPPRLFNCTHPLYRAVPQFFPPLRFTHTHLQTLFVTYHICVMQFVYFHECTMHNGKLLFAFNGSQINPRIFCEYRIVFQGCIRGCMHE